MLGNYGNPISPRVDKKFEPTETQNATINHEFPLAPVKVTLAKTEMALRHILSAKYILSSVCGQDRLPFDRFCPKFDRNLQSLCKDHIPNFIPVAVIVFELSCSRTDRQT
ncbi:hypothetical protein AVEN_223263-1 [Araneus ventricosus]|uniref:Uncharacterized protein n=1 Tax=Araneus ventricosus TaxID=182803 RepID=A0A4Y2NW94_ARAVE|nr:hypothetical protein AVEN_223263-1 [Araneus ventricosus]